MTIELKYQNPVNGRIFHYFFPAGESRLALDYLQDAVACNQVILIWRLLHTEDIHVG